MSAPTAPRKAVIIGGAGFIASHLADELLAHGVQVRLFSRQGADDRNIAHLKDRTEHIQGEFGDPEHLSRALEGMEHVYHLVSATSPASGDRDPEFDAASNIVGTVRLLGQCVKHGVQRVIYVSSGGTVYGIPQQLPVPEEHPLDPINAYGIGKMTIERYLGLFLRLHGLEHRILRVANAYGERQRSDRKQGVVPVWLSRALTGGTMTIWGDGSVVRDLVHVSDIARALRLASEHTGERRIFNIGSGQGTSMLQLGQAIEAVTGRHTPIAFMPSRGEDVPVNVLDVRAAAAELGWRPLLSLHQGLERTWQWMVQEHERATVQARIA